jgi:23S rRNA (pseudouridine1915-N3)-methyltransferase
MYKVKIYSVGKTKETWLQEALSLYEERLKTRLSIEWVLCKTDAKLEEILSKETSFVCLTPEGKQYTSPDFSSALIRWLTESGSKLTFVIGGPEGISLALKRRAKALLSLSPMTFTHQVARLILVEQLYRSLEIDKGSGYHK